jgi:broad specificity phosphatase PhoE
VPTDLILIRHGESVPNVEPIVGGMQGDVGLTDRGRRQAELLEERLRTQPVKADRLFASTLPRALETAEYVSRALQLPIETRDDLQELRPGRADGLSLDEWHRRFPGREDGLAATPFRPFSPGGESWALFLVRVGAALTELVAEHPDETLVVVCHGGVLEASFFLALGLGPTSKQAAFAPLNTSITHWRHIPPSVVDAEWTLVTFNDAGHLAGEPDAGEREAGGQEGAGQQDGDRQGGSHEQAVPTPAEEN